MPPNGATSLAMIPVLTPTTPTSNPLCHPIDAAYVAGIATAREAQLAAVCHRETLRFGTETDQRGHGTECLLPDDPH